MFRFRPGLASLAMTLCALALSSRLAATPALTAISDTLFNSDGTLFNGAVVISWPNFEASDTTNVAIGTRSVAINNGILYTQLIPTTTANTAALYTVQYNSFGVTQFSEAWAVPPSDIALRVRDVRLAAGTVTGTAPAVVTTISIADVTGLQDALNVRPSLGTSFAVSRAAVIDPTGAFGAAVGILSDCVHVDGTSAPCSSTSSTSTAFIDGEVPGGTLDGVNAAFTLANAPAPASGLALFRNGLLLNQGGDYTLSSMAIAFATGAVPQPGDILQASYRLSASVTGVGFVDQETPSGATDGVNAAFTLSQTPSPSVSLAVYRNGVRLTSAVDYTLAGATITFVAGLLPQSGDTLSCSYRIAQ